MRILVTGSEGFIGSNLIRNLSKDNYVCGVDIQDQKDYNKNINYYYRNCDLCDSDNTKEIIKYEEPDVIIHLASHPGISWSIKNPDDCIKNNYDSSLNLLEAVRLLSLDTRFIYASSSSVYGRNSNKDRLKESDADNVTVGNPYALSKVMTEKIFQLYNLSYGIRSIGLRFFNIYGPYLRDDLVINIFIRDIMNKTKSIVTDTSRDFTYIDDVISSIRLMIRGYANYDIYNIGRSESIRIETLYKMLQLLMNKDNLYTIICPKSWETIYTEANIDRLKSDLNYTPTVSIFDGLKKYLSWYKDYHGIKKF